MRLKMNKKKNIQRVGEFEWFFKILLNNLIGIGLIISMFVLVGFVLILVLFLIHINLILGIISGLLPLIIAISYVEYKT